MISTRNTTRTTIPSVFPPRPKVPRRKEKREQTTHDKHAPVRAEWTSCQILLKTHRSRCLKDPSFRWSISMRKRSLKTHIATYTKNYRITYPHTSEDICASLTPETLRVRCEDQKRESPRRKEDASRHPMLCMHPCGLNEHFFHAEFVFGDDEPHMLGWHKLYYVNMTPSQAARKANTTCRNAGNCGDLDCQVILYTKRLRCEAISL